MVAIIFEQYNRLYSMQRFQFTVAAPMAFVTAYCAYFKSTHFNIETLPVHYFHCNGSPNSMSGIFQPNRCGVLVEIIGSARSYMTYQSAVQSIS
eukprot:COSAG02_NODE_3083_length_7406_cov_3.325578_7_plen_94_part_00